MKKITTFSQFNKFIFIMVFCLSVFKPAFSQQKSALDRARDMEMANIDEGVQTQEHINKLEDERAQMLANYRSTLKQFDDLKGHNDHLRTLIKSQEEERASLNSQISRITGLERGVIPLMQGMLDTLERFVEVDIPFLLEQRRNRITKLKALFNDANITKAEKYRRILEAYQIENDYGRHIETYEGNLGDSDEAQIVNFLKIGRVTFMYQTMDGQNSFIWDKQNKSWQALDKRYNAQLKLAMRMAKDQIPPNLLFVPVNVATNPST